MNPFQARYCDDHGTHTHTLAATHRLPTLCAYFSKARLQLLAKLKVQCPMVLAPWIECACTSRTFASALHIFGNSQNVLALSAKYRTLVSSRKRPDKRHVCFAGIMTADAGVELLTAEVLDGDDVEWGVPVSALRQRCHRDAVNDWNFLGIGYHDSLGHVELFIGASGLGLSIRAFGLGLFTGAFGLGALPSSAHLLFLLSELLTAVSKVAVTLTIVEELVTGAGVYIKVFKDVPRRSLALALKSFKKPHPTRCVHMFLYRMAGRLSARHLRAKLWSL